MNAHTQLGRLSLSVTQRAWLYRVILAAGTVALVYGWASGKEVAAWVGFAAALLGNGVAAGHTSTGRRARRLPEQRNDPPARP